MGDQLRFSSVPWLDDAEDLRPYGPPETRVELYDGQEIALGLWIPHPFGRDTDAILAVHAERDGRVTLAITDTLTVEPEPAMNMRLLSNPVRYDFRDDDTER